MERRIQPEPREKFQVLVLDRWKVMEKQFRSGRILLELAISFLSTKAS